MKRYNISFGRGALSLVMLVLALAFGSCTKEPMSQSEQSDKEYADFALELTPPGAFTTIQTRSLTSEQQNAVTSVEILVFKDNVLSYHKTGTVTDINGVQKRVVVSLKTSKNESDLFDIMVIGNPPTDFDFAPYVAKTKDELKAAFTVSAEGKWTGSEFIMYGEAPQALIRPTTNNFKIQMLRPLARVDIGVGAYDNKTDSWAGIPGVFSLTEVRVVNSRDRFAVIPSATTLSESGGVKVSNPTIPSDAGVQGTTAETAITYSGPTEIIDGKYTKSTIFIAEAPNTSDDVILLIGGSYRGGETTFYRVDMCVPRGDASGKFDYINILRNHLYRISITKVMGPGYTSPEEALISAPANIKSTLTPMEEGGSGDALFDGNNFILVDASSVQIYGDPDGVKSYPITTVQADFVEGANATITGVGITTPLNLESGVPQIVSAVIPIGIIEGSYTITVGKLTKTINLRVQPAIDAHFDCLLFDNVASINILNPKSWLTLSQNKTYVKDEQQDSYIVSTTGKACLHFDENIDTTGKSRLAQALVLRRSNEGTTRVYIEQRNLNGMVLGNFGGAKDSQGYTKKLAIESLEEYRERIYDDSSIEITTTNGMQWGFINRQIGTTNKELGYAGTIALAKRTDSGIATPHTIYNNYPARYCYDKNRDINGDGTIGDDEVLWYLPAQNQMMSAFIVQNGMGLSGNRGVYWSVTEAEIFSFDIALGTGYTGMESRGMFRYVRCVREL